MVTEVVASLSLNTRITIFMGGQSGSGQLISLTETSNLPLNT